MSVAATKWAFAQVVDSTATKIVLLALADFASAEDFACWPSQATLARMCGVHERTVRGALLSLEDQGLITRSRRAGPRGHRGSDLIQLAITDPPNPSGPEARLDEPSPTGPDARLVEESQPQVEVPTGSAARLDACGQIDPSGPDARLEAVPTGSGARLEPVPTGPDARLDVIPSGREARLGESLPGLSPGPTGSETRVTVREPLNPSIGGLRKSGTSPRAREDDPPSKFQPVDYRARPAASRVGPRCAKHRALWSPPQCTDCIGPRCGEHRLDWEPPPCGACKDARLAAEAHHAAETAEREAAEREAAEREAADRAAAQAAARRARQSAVEACELCDEAGRRLGPGGTPGRDCSHIAPGGRQRAEARLAGTPPDRVSNDDVRASARRQAEAKIEAREAAIADRQRAIDECPHCDRDGYRRYGSGLMCRHNDPAAAGRALHAAKTPAAVGEGIA